MCDIINERQPHKAWFYTVEAIKCLSPMVKFQGLDLLLEAGEQMSSNEVLRAIIDNMDTFVYDEAD